MDPVGYAGSLRLQYGFQNVRARAEVRFDERLALYGWLEDKDFSRTARNPAGWWNAIRSSASTSDSSTAACRARSSATRKSSTRGTSLRRERCR